MSYWRTLRFAPASGTPLCRIDEVPDGQGREIVFGDGKDAFRIVVFRFGEMTRVYRNCCPHFSLPLNYEPNRFHTFGENLLMCAHHTAIFRLADGLCIDGPCPGERLEPIPVSIAAGLLRVA
jgi:nitrite reductase/ring-hydroxylating ferredoxin subunit